jgi:glycosyltransferase involved in cell wall biosynthesis
LVLIGEGPLRDEVQRQAGELGDAVVLPGYQPYSKLPQFYAISDVFVHPCIDEPWGVSVQEALACGLPVLVAEGVGARFDLLEDGVTGWTFANGDAAALTAKLDELALDGALRQRMSAAVNTHAHQMDYAYSLAQFSAAIEEHSHRH